MKTLIVSTVVVLLAVATVGANAQTTTKEVKKELKTEKKEARQKLRKLEGQQVSSKARDNFRSDFDNTSNAKWVRGPQFDEVTFTKDGKVMTAYYDYNSALVGTTSNKTFADLPAKAQKEIKNKI